ncbi:PadR family transcriptional regulator [Streptomyces scabiei]|uniref:PadR family transcriptional regulator n=1 Tax=Streptomyces scabiei TaxID=1930 RepID=UPI001B3307AA|nr:MULTISPECIES: PadR family transcriptional regulator [Streptomyces]MBP5890006.1 PadR family transcriptional regulator [Streptomyces sp. LBUM 1481]MBP5920044.1 PadR family transcriptional regulator [Streptomyces sp. LBUM 1483]MDX2687732.1 PadR family transcriptional regulator [Streptomyces scabiei]MDX2752774.1 PadR family transcriptional regulator [Streptomyces scabiei]MDX2806902.1 PadR family transcriptional regulator [Streptomyces scabiei]
MSIGLTLSGLLESGPRHGYGLKRAFDEKFGHDRPPHHGQVYSTMSRLLKNGLVEVDGTVAGEGPERKRYVITEAGVTVLTDREASVILDTQRSEHLRMIEADLRWLELTAARLDKPARAVTR